jgi:divalent metal cation (Fe/Co/Zn/Cd) transporter
MYGQLRAQVCVKISQQPQVENKEMVAARTSSSQVCYYAVMAELALNRQAFARRGRQLEYFTIAWNTLEGLVAVISGAMAGSVSLVGFGIDSFIEVTSGSTLLWRMSVDADEEKRERNEKLSLRIVGVCFLALAVYVAYESASDLLDRKQPEHSIPGIALACVSLIVMPLLSRAKKKVGNSLASAAMRADAKQTDFCVYLAVILLAGLLLNAALGWWWADPIAALIMVPIIAREGIDGMKAKSCC